MGAGEPGEINQVGPGTETKLYTDGTTATGVAPLPDLSPAQQEAVDEPVIHPVEPISDPEPLPPAA